MSKAETFTQTDRFAYEQKHEFFVFSGKRIRVFIRFYSLQSVTLLFHNLAEETLQWLLTIPKIREESCKFVI